MFDVPSWVVPIATAIVGFVLAFIWNRWWRRQDDAEASSKNTIKDHGAKLIVLDQRVAVVEAKDDARQETIGTLKAEQSRLEGKVSGLQDFWRSEFGKLREELRQDQQATEQRLTALLTGHQQRVHERLNIIAADQARMLTEFVDQLVDKRAS